MTAVLLTSLIISTIGAGYFLYGKKESELWFMLCGVAMCFFPYLVSAVELQIVIGGCLMYLPFFARRWE